MAKVFRNIPSVSELLETPALKHLVDRVHHSTIVTGVRSLLDDLRSEVQNAAAEISIPSPAELSEQIAAKIMRNNRPKLRTALNATGILLHTGLGRAPLSEEAVAAVAEIARGYASVELDLGTGQRSHRTDAVAPLLCTLTGAESAIVVNNNAAATVLTLAAIAQGREVVVSRGQLVEIGGSFRLPDVMEQSGAVMREVGTTNKTRIADFRDAITPDTGALLRVHTSNYRVIGFTEQPTLAELVALGKLRNVPVLDDIGSGALINLAKYGFQDEPLIANSISAGAAVVLFSGDKLVGGPQCGIIVGKKKWIKRLSTHPLMRAFRVDKMTLAALHATLTILAGSAEQAEQRLPLLTLLSTPLDNLKNRAERIAAQISSAKQVANAEAQASTAYLGGGAVPTEGIDSWCVSIEPAGLSLAQLTRQLRERTPAIVGRVQQDRLLLDLRTVPPAGDRCLVEAFVGSQDS
ncbi:MAG: L-seryl-tRNA(Sec) selenium transferase [Pirellulaceae bacterium]